METTFRVKICGITTVDDARTAARAGADAVGLNFYAKSPRCVELDEARRIIGALPPGVAKVGVFVNASGAEVCRTFDELGLDLVQLHGDEPPYFLRELGARPVVRAFRLGTEGLYPVGKYLAECRGMKCTPRMTLIDAHVKDAYGGTGQTVDWQSLKSYRTIRSDEPIPPLVLAGGLTPDNVALAVRTVRPAAVDTASGVESSPGRKSAVLVERFVAAALDALGPPDGGR